jgi:hypothetical protein
MHYGLHGHHHLVDHKEPSIYCGFCSTFNISYPLRCLTWELHVVLHLILTQTSLRKRYKISTRARHLVKPNKFNLRKTRSLTNLEVVSIVIIISKKPRRRWRKGYYSKVLTVSFLTYYFICTPLLFPSMNWSCQDIWILFIRYILAKENIWHVDLFSFHEGKFCKQYHKLINLQVPWSIYHSGRGKEELNISEQSILPSIMKSTSLHVMSENQNGYSSWPVNKKV